MALNYNENEMIQDSLNITFENQFQNYDYDIADPAYLITKMIS